jgi:hypothetical protein
MCKEMPFIWFTGVVDKKRIIRNSGGPRRRRGTRDRCPPPKKKESGIASKASLGHGQLRRTDNASKLQKRHSERMALRQKRHLGSSERVICSAPKASLCQLQKSDIVSKASLR